MTMLWYISLMAILLLPLISATSPMDCEMMACDELPPLDGDGMPCQAVMSMNGCCQMCALGRYEKCGHFHGECREGLTCDWDPDYPGPEEYGFTGMCKKFAKK